MTGTVEVLLSTFNGAKYVAELLDSVWAQDHPDLQLSVRDDGSTDSTLSLLERSLSARQNATIAGGPNLGAGNSFLTLLHGVRPTSSYAAFCDQDDLWLPGKLSAAVIGLAGARGAGALLLCCRPDDRGHVLHPHLPSWRAAARRSKMPWSRTSPPAAPSSSTGRPSICSHPRSPKDFLMHDAWCYLVLAGCGQVVYDPTPWVQYRLHRSNAIGVGRTLWAEWSGRLSRQLAEGHLRVLTRQAEELRRLYRQDMRPAAARSLDDFLEAQTPFGRRLGYALKGAAHRQRPLDDIIYRSLYAAHRI